jgi:C4-dicarboxylate-specific signal transduction histidine kinase
MNSVLDLDCADSMGIYFATNDKELLLHSYTGLSPEFANHIKLIGKNSPYAKQIFDKKSIFGNYENDYNLAMDDIRRKEGIKSLAVVPMIYRESVIGCINIASKKYGNMSQSDRNAIELLATRIANMMIFLKSQEELKAIRKRLEEKVEIQSKELQESTDQIRSINKNLEKKITNAVYEKTRQQSIIMQKSKLESLGELAAGIAHEINQPLGIMALALENLQVKFNKGIATEKYRNEKINFVFENIFRIRKIIDHIRTFSRDSDTSTIGELDINRAVKRCLNLIGTQYLNHNIDIQLLLNDNTELAIGDTNAFEQVILNLLSNAKHSVDEKEAELIEVNYQKKITIKSFNKKDKVILIVEDNGLGIPKENINRIFDPFFTTKPEGVGTGLGLSIVFGIIKDMKGNIFVESEQSKFARFTIELPKY